jgi:hypothetical protein
MNDGGRRERYTNSKQQKIFFSFTRYGIKGIEVGTSKLRV